MAPFLVDIAAAQEPARAVTQPPRVLAEFEVSKHGDQITLPVTVGGKTCRFVVDTGCAVCVFDRRLRHLLGPERGQYVANCFEGRRQVTVYEAPTFAAGEVTFVPRLHAVCDDLDSLHVSEKHVDGFIGIDALADKIFTIDFDLGRLRFLDRADASLGAPCPLIPIRDERTPGMITEMFSVAATLSAHSEAFLVLRNRPREDVFIVDTGLFGLGTALLGSPLFDAMLAKNEIARFAPADTTSQSMAGAFNIEGARLPSFRLEQFSHDDLIVYSSGNANGRENCIGLGYLSRYIVTFDFPNRMMYLRRGQHFNRTDGYPLSGLVLVKDGTATIASEVAAHSPAARAGIQVGDEILSVDRLDASKESLFAIGRQFTWPGRRRVAILRDGAHHEVELILEHLDQEAPPPEPPDGPTAEPTKRS